MPGSILLVFNVIRKNLECISSIRVMSSYKELNLMTRETRRDEGSRLRRGRERRPPVRSWMMTKSQDCKDNRAEVRSPARLARDLHSEGCHSKVEDPRDLTSPHQHDRKQRKWTQTTPQTLVMRVLRRNLPLLRENHHKGNLLQGNLHKANLHKANPLQAKVHQVESQPNRGNLLGKVHKTINKANLKGLIRNVSKLRLP